MPLEDYLAPGEDVKFQSTANIKYGNKGYQVIVTNRRVLLYSRRGLIFKSDDVVTQKLDELQGMKYKEKGIIAKKGIIEIHGKTLMQLYGDSGEIKTLYQQLLQFM